MQGSHFLRAVYPPNITRTFLQCFLTVVSRVSPTRSPYVLTLILLEVASIIGSGRIPFPIQNIFGFAELNILVHLHRYTYCHRSLILFVQIKPMIASRVDVNFVRAIGVRGDERIFELDDTRRPCVGFGESRNCQSIPVAALSVDLLPVTQPSCPCCVFVVFLDAVNGSLQNHTCVAVGAVHCVQRYHIRSFHTQDNSL